ncbi:hypothetical protein D3C87_574200 [compost metagenome]
MKEVLYAGIFFDTKSFNILKSKAPTLDRIIECPHLTLEFKPETLIHENFIGRRVEVLVTGHANNNKNQGFSAILYSRLQSLYKNTNPPHITVSLDPLSGKPVDTGKLQFKPIEPFSVFGRIGYYTKNGIKFDNDFS